MTGGQDDFVTIRPRRAPLAGVAEASIPGVAVAQRAPADGPHWVKRFGLAGVIMVLVGLIVWVFVFLPSRIDAPLLTAPPTASTAAPSVSPSPTAAADAPFQSLQQDLERRKVQGLLARFVELQIRLDDEMSVATWASDDFAAAQRLANEGDKKFLAGQYETATGLYQDGIAALEALIKQGDALFDDALAEALTAMARNRLEEASSALDRAAQVHPQDPRLAASRQRLERMPDVQRARLQGDDTMNAGKWLEAATAYQRALDLDPALEDLRPLIDEARRRAAEQSFSALLSDAYAALDDGRLDDARRAFSEAQRRRPGDQAAIDGLNQVEQAGTLNRIQALKNSAEAAESAEDWTRAAESYRQARAIDAALKFAVDGENRATARIGLDNRLEAALADPGALSNDDVFSTTVALYDEAVKIASPGPRLSAQLDRLEAMLAIAAEPVPVVLTSDDATEVTVYQVGRIGTFSRKELRLRPGRYVVTGTRKGCRDLRLELEVAAAMSPVDVRCREALSP